MEWYRCPHAAYTISRAVHLARLGAFDPACRSCPHRHDAADLAPSRARAWQVLEAANQCPQPDTYDGAVFGTLHNQISLPVVRRLALGWAHFVIAGHAREHGNAASPADGGGSVRVLLAGDGRPESVPLLAAACEGLRMAGCHVLDMGAALAPAAVNAAAREGAALAVYVGNPPGRPHTAGVCLWGPRAEPAAAGDLSTAMVRAPGALRHEGGGWQPLSAREPYLSCLRPWYHGLRPLRFVLHSTSRVLGQWLAELLDQTGCEARWPPLRLAVLGEGGGASKEVPAGPHLKAVDSSQVFAGGEGAAASSLGPHGEALAALRYETLAAAAHFGIWCDGDGRRCVVLDERGRMIPPERLLVALVCLLAAHRRAGSTAVVLEQACRQETQVQLAALGIRVHRCEAGRSVRQAIIDRGAIAGGGPSGCLWFDTAALASDGTAGTAANAGPQLDALAVLTLWLHLLSLRDLPASQAVEQPLRGCPPRHVRTETAPPGE